MPYEGLHTVDTRAAGDDLTAQIGGAAELVWQNIARKIWVQILHLLAFVAEYISRCAVGQRNLVPVMALGIQDNAVDFDFLPGRQSLVGHGRGGSAVLLGDGVAARQWMGITGILDGGFAVGGV